jgi:hypothetical protein
MDIFCKFASVTYPSFGCKAGIVAKKKYATGIRNRLEISWTKGA